MSTRERAVHSAKDKPDRVVKQQTTPCPQCEIEVVDENGKVLSSVQKRCVGERIVLKVRTKKGSGTLHDIQWTIPGMIVKNYEDNETFARLKEFNDKDKKAAEIIFYWVEGGQGRSVEVRGICECNGKDSNKSASVQFDVKAPKLENFTSVTDTVGFDDPAAPTLVTFGVASPGIKWKWKVTVPDLVDGEVKDVQIILGSTKRTVGGKKQVWTIAGTKVPPGAWQLDTTNPYSLPGDFSTDGYPKLIPKGQSHSNEFTSDSPSSPLSGTTAKQVDDKFKYYIMYKPKTADAIWVPVAVASWLWNFDAKLQSGRWRLSSKGQSANPSGSITTTFPLFESNVKNNIWQDE